MTAVSLVNSVAFSPSCRDFYRHVAFVFTVMSRRRSLVWKNRVLGLSDSLLFRPDIIHWPCSDGIRLSEGRRKPCRAGAVSAWTPACSVSYPDSVWRKTPARSSWTEIKPLRTSCKTGNDPRTPCTLPAVCIGRRVGLLIISIW